jgi:hypothetical protein
MNKWKIVTIVLAVIAVLFFFVIGSIGNDVDHYKQLVESRDVTIRNLKQEINDLKLQLASPSQEASSVPEIKAESPVQQPQEIITVTRTRWIEFRDLYRRKGEAGQEPSTA